MTFKILEINKLNSASKWTLTDFGSHRKSAGKSKLANKIKASVHFSTCNQKNDRDKKTRVK